jgi:hypothetical protein
LEIWIGNALITIFAILGSNLIIFRKGIETGTIKTLNKLEEEGYIEFEED